MKKKLKGKKQYLESGINPSKLGAPAFRSPYEGRFKDPEEAKRVLFAVAFFLRSQKHLSQSASSSDSFGFAIERVEISPSEELKRIRMETRFASGSVILHVPKVNDETEESFSIRERQILAEFSATIYEAQMRSAWEFYWSLDGQGKKILIESYEKSNKPHEK